MTKVVYGHGSRGVPATLSDGNTKIRLVSADIRQSGIGEEKFEGTIAFPMVTGNEGMLREFYLNMAADLDLRKWEISYFGTQVRYQLDRVDWTELRVAQGAAIGIEARITCEKIITEPSPYRPMARVTEEVVISPVRLYTWNDAVCSVHEDGKEVIPANAVRSVTMRFTRGQSRYSSASVAPSGSLVILGENVHVFDPTKVATVEVGYQLKTLGIFHSLNTMKIGGARFKEWPGYVEEDAFAIEREVVNGVEILKEVNSQSLLCTRLDWEA